MGSFKNYDFFIQNEDRTIFFKRREKERKQTSLQVNSSEYKYLGLKNSRLNLVNRQL